MQRPAFCWLLSLAIVLVVRAPLLADATQHRRLLIRPYPLGKAVCRNTIAGPFYYADDKGSVCSAAEFEFKTGCCTSGKKHDCDKCNPVDNCCASYEHCVSCCMAPSSNPEALMKEVHVVRGDPASALWPDTFEFCRFYCRTHGRSTSHENAYIGARHHCFSKLGKPLLEPPLPAGALDGVTVVMSAEGDSCDSACKAASGTCSQQHLATLNSCDRLREHINCEAGCVAEAPAGGMPYYVDGDAPKSSRPALCVVGLKGTAVDASQLSCSSKETHQKRLCPCKKGEAAR